MRRAGKEPAASPDADLAGPARRTRQRTQSRGPPQLDLFASPSVASGPGRALPPAGVGPPIPFPLEAAPVQGSILYLPAPSDGGPAQASPTPLVGALLLPGSALQVRLRIGFEPRLPKYRGEGEHLKALEAGGLSEIITCAELEPCKVIALVEHCVEALDFAVDRAPFPRPQPLVAALSLEWEDLNDVVRAPLRCPPPPNLLTLCRRPAVGSGHHPCARRRSGRYQGPCARGGDGGRAVPRETLCELLQGFAARHHLAHVAAHAPRRV